MISPSLSGLRVVVTRPVKTGEELEVTLRAADARVLSFPAITIDPLPLTQAARAVVRGAATFDYGIFISPSAIEQFFTVAGAQQAREMRAAVVGAGSAATLQRHGVTNILVPPVGVGAQALLDMAALQDVAQQRIAVFAGAGGRPLLVPTLRRRGAQVTRVDLYRRAPPHDKRPLTTWLTHYPQSVLLVTSCTAIEHLSMLMVDRDRQRLLHAPLVVSSQRVVKKAESLGFKRIIRAEDASDAALIAALAKQQRSDHE